MSQTKKAIPKKNYLILIFTILITLLLCFFAYKIINASRNNKLNTSALSRIIGEVQYDELGSSFLEQSSDVFLYIGYTGNKDVYNLELKLKNIIVDNNIQDNVLYYNATPLMNENNYVEKINEKLNLKEQTIEEIPAIIYYKDNKFMDLITSSKKNVFNDGNFTQLLEKYDIIK